MSYYLTVFLVALTALCWLALATVAPESGGLPVAFANLTTFLTALSGASVAELLLMALLQHGAKSEKTTDLLRGLTSLALYGVALLLWLRYALGFDITNLLATSAVVTVIVGLAMQSTLVSLFSGLSLELEHPLRVGDYLRMTETEGRVEALRWRSILLKTADSAWIVVPNVTLTTQKFEVIRRDSPSRMTVKFLVPASTPPAKVMAVARGVLKSGVPQVLRDPAPSVLLVGAESDNESLRYVLRFYSLALLDRSSMSSDLLTRLYYALSREGMEMRADCASFNIVDGAAVSSFRPGLARLETSVPATIPSGLASNGRRLSFGPGEVIPSDLAGFVVGGSARETTIPDEIDVAARIAELLARPAPSKAGLLIPEEELASISAWAAGFIGPVANAIAERCARLVGDPYLVYHALAQSIPDADERRRFLAEAPSSPTRLLTSGAPFGWAALLGFEPEGLRRRVVDEEADLLLARRSDLIGLLRNEDAETLAGVLSSESGLIGIEKARLVERIRDAAKNFGEGAN
jgi:small-conductance mechanosensitive channel